MIYGGDFLETCKCNAHAEQIHSKCNAHAQKGGPDMTPVLIIVAIVIIFIGWITFQFLTADEEPEDME